jgi:hypothetical protein
LRGWEFDGGLWDALVRFGLVWLWLKLEVKKKDRSKEGEGAEGRVGERYKWIGRRSDATPIWPGKPDARDVLAVPV